MTALDLLGIAALVASAAGYLWAGSRRLGIDREYLPIALVSAATLVTFMCGLAGLLLVGAICVLAGGLVCLGFEVVRAVRDHRLPRPHIGLTEVTLTVVAVAFLVFLSGCRLIHYDNFSHWAIVVKQMLLTNAVPTADSVLIDFKNYPLGTSSFIYLVCRFAGHAQATMIVAQDIMLFSCFYALFGIIHDHRRFLLCALMLLGEATLTFFNLAIRIDNLLVDFLLPLYTLALFSVAYHYRSDPIRAAGLFAPIAGTLVVIKSTGIAFAIFGLVFLAVELVGTARREGASVKTAIGSVAASAGLMLVPYLAWTYHVSSVMAGVTNKFATSATAIGDATTAKTTEQVAQICSAFAAQALDPSTRPVMGIIILNVVTVLVWVITRKVLGKHWHILKALLALDGVVVLYYLGILALYLFSMPWDEAMALDGFERYASSIIVLAVGGVVMVAVAGIGHSFTYHFGDRAKGQEFKSVATKRRYQQVTVATLTIAACLLLSDLNGMAWIENSYDETLPAHVEEVVGDAWPASGEVDETRYLFYAPDTNGQVTNYYLQYLGRYYLYAPNVDGICEFWGPNMNNLLSQYDTLVIAESDDSCRTLLSRTFGVSGEAGTYRIDKLANGNVSLTYEGSAQDAS